MRKTKMSTEYTSFTLECCLQYGPIVRMFFNSKEDAVAAQGKLSEAMSKGKYQSDDIVHIESPGSTYDIRAAEIMSVSVNDGAGWLLREKEHRAHRESLGLPNA
jgi:hypothetical protein